MSTQPSQAATTHHRKFDWFKAVIAIAALLVTAAQCMVAFYAYRTEEKKAAHDISQADWEATVGWARLLIENPHMFDQEENRNLGAQIANSLPDTPIKLVIIERFSIHTNSLSELQRRERDPSVAATLKSIRKVDIHYEGANDRPTIDQIVQTLRTAGWIAFADYDPKGVEQVPQSRVVRFKNLSLDDAKDLAAMIEQALTKPPGSLKIQNYPVHEGALFGVWLKPLAR